MHREQDRVWKMHSSRKQRTEENRGRAANLTSFEIPKQYIRDPRVQMRTWKR
jgi:hypothetical protein